MSKPEANRYIHVCPLIFSFLLILMQVLFYGEKSDPFDDYPLPFALTNVVSIAHLCSAVIFVLFFFIFEAPLLIKLDLFAPKKTKKSKQVSSVDLALPRIREHHQRPAYKFRDFIVSVECWYHVAYLTLSILSALAPVIDPAEYGPWALQSLLLCHYLRRSSARTVMLSVQKGGPLLIKTAKVICERRCCLQECDSTLVVQVGVVWVLFFSMIGWSFFATEITVYNDCKTFYQCIMLGMDKGTRGLGIILCLLLILISCR